MGHSLFFGRIPTVLLVVFLVFSASLLQVFISGCASGSSSVGGGRRTSTEPSYNYKDSKADAGAFGSIDGFTFGKPQSIRPANDHEFYYKECDQTAKDRAHYSKTAYSCSPSPID